MEYFRLLFDHLAWIEHEFLSGIRKAGNLWGMMRGVGGVRKSIDQSWLAKGLGVGVGLLCWAFKGVQEEIVTDYLTKMGIKTIHHPPHRPDLAFCDFCLFPKLRGCRYEKIEEMKKALTKVIDTLTQENFDGAFQKLLDRYNKCIAVGWDYFEGD